MTCIEVYANKYRVALLAVVSAVLAAAATIPILHPDPASGIPLASVVAALFVVLLGLWAVGQSLAILFSSQPRVIVTEQGISIRSRLFGVSLIRWQEIDTLVARRQVNQTVLRIELVDPDAVSARQTALQRWAYLLAKNTSVRKSSTLSTADGLLAQSTDALLEQIRHLFAHELAQYGIRISPTR
jgi:hypothetical protein